MNASHRQSHAERAPTISAWLASVAVHASLLVLLAVTTRAIYLRGVQPAPETNVVLGLTEETPELGEDAAEGGISEASAGQLQIADELSLQESAPVVEASEFPAVAATPASPAANLQPGGASILGLPGASSSHSASSASGDREGSGDGSGSGEGHGRAMRALAQLTRPARLSVFGAVEEGSRFVFVFDHSTSMDGAPLAAAKEQLLASLEGLDSVHQFQVIFFNHEVQAWDMTGGQRRIPFATESNKELARRFVAGVVADGGTERKAPLLKALAWGPDAIFFLTDADDVMPAYDVAEAVERAQRSGTAIACIEFGAGPAPEGDSFLKQLAHDTGGDYVYVDTTMLAPWR
jgi:hypothetical protein